MQALGREKASPRALSAKIKSATGLEDCERVSQIFGKKTKTITQMALISESPIILPLIIFPQIKNEQLGYKNFLDIFYCPRATETGRKNYTVIKTSSLFLQDKSSILVENPLERKYSLTHSLYHPKQKFGDLTRTSDK